MTHQTKIDKLTANRMKTRIANQDFAVEAIKADKVDKGMSKIFNLLSRFKVRK